MSFRSTAVSAAVLCAIAQTAAAQNGVTIYGIIDTGVEYQRASAGATGPSTSSRQVVTGTYSSSRLGFRGSEDLGDGLRASFVLEHGFNSDDGTAASPMFWNRKSVVGLSGRWGELLLGRDYTPGFWVQLLTDVNTFSLFGNAGTMSQFAITGMLRANNGVYYLSPELGGFRARLHYSFGDERGSAPKDSGVIKGISGEYRSGALAAGAWYQTRAVVFPAGSSNTEDSRYAGAGVLYDLGSWTVDAGYSRFDPAGPDTAASGVTTGLWTGVRFRFGLSEVRVNAGRIRTDYASGQDARSTVFGLNYAYALSKRTSLYAGVGRVGNNAAAQVALEAGTRPIPAAGGRGSDPSAVTFGVRHAF
jgi:predicted porin